MAETRPIPTEPIDDDALVERLYELARERIRGREFDRDEFARIDAMVYSRLGQTYGDGQTGHRAS